MANYRRLSFGAGSITAEKLNALVENVDYLYERMMRGHFYHLDLAKDTNLRMQGMVLGLWNQINNVSRYTNAYWQKPFSPPCSPILADCHFFSEKIIVSHGLRNLNGGPFPDNAGFRVEMYAGDAGFGSEWAGDHWVSVVALGW